MPPSLEVVYQIIFIGAIYIEAGLAHLSASDPDVNPDDVVKILSVNRNAFLLIDSDKSQESDAINPTKQRLIEEIRKFGGKALVTAGKEVENYIPINALSSFYNNQNLTALEQYQDIVEYLDRIKKDEGKRFQRQKVLFAKQICPYLTKDHLMTIYDLNEQISEACNLIRKWNGQATTGA